MNKNAYIPALTGIRAIAAYMVFFHHYLPDVGYFFLRIIKEFHIGVSIFFVLSGFLIYFRYADKCSFSKAFFLSYYQKRIARIIPLFYVVVLINFIIYFDPNVAIISTSINHLLLELSFLKGFFDSYKFIGVSQGWTLTVEETFYFLFPFIILLSRKRNPLFSFISILTVGLALYFLGHYLQFHNFFYPINFVLLYTFFGRAFEFFIGMQLGKTFVSKAEENINERLIPARTLIGIGGIFLVLYLMSMYQGPKYIYGIFHPTGIILNNLVLPIFIYFLFEGLIFENSLLKDILSTKTFDLLGKSSYAFYLIHFTLMRAILKPIGLPYLLFFVLIILISIFAYYLIEEPARKFINGIGRK